MGAQLLAEFIGTFWLILGGCGSAVLAAAFPELGIGFTGVSLAFGLTVLTNTSVNPARSSAPALFAGMAYVQQLWLFWRHSLARRGARHRAMLS